MGADGGLCWVLLKDNQPETARRFQALVEPLELTRREGHYSEYHGTWLEEHPLPDRAVVGRASRKLLSGTPWAGAG
jgi:hypothetical protein